MYVNGVWLADCYPGDKCTAANQNLGAGCLSSIEIPTSLAEGGGGGAALLQVNLTYTSTSSYFCDVFRATVVLDVADRLVSCPPSLSPCVRAYNLSTLAASAPCITW